MPTKFTLRKIDHITHYTAYHFFTYALGYVMISRENKFFVTTDLLSYSKKIIACRPSGNIYHSFIFISRHE